MAEAATKFAKEQAVVTATSQSCKITNGDSKVIDKVNQIASHTLKQKSIASFITPQTIACGIDILQTHTTPTFQPFDLANDGYLSSDSSMSSSKKSLFLYVEVESSNTVIISVMVTEADNAKEQLASIKATLDKLSRESAEKDPKSSVKNDQIDKLMKKLEKKSSETSNKCSDEEDSNKKSNHNEKPNDEWKAKKDAP